MVDQLTPVPSMDMSTLTPKQQEMALARNPMSGNQQNNLLQEQRDANRQIDDSRKGIALTSTARKEAAVPTQAQTQAGSAAAGSVQRGLTTFSNRLAAKIGNIVSGGDVQQLALDLPEGFEPVWNPETEQFESPDMGNVGYDVSKIAEQKRGEIEQLKEEMSPFFEYQQIGDQTVAQAKSFQDVLSQFADLNGNGVIDPEEERYLNDSFEIAKMIQRLEKLNPYSSEAAALREQLTMMDQQGLVSGIYRAMDQYNRLVGEEGKGAEFYGDIGTDALNLEKLVNMTTQDLENELMRSLTGQTTIFGQDFASALTENRVRSNLEKSLAFDIETRNAFVDAARDWGNAIDTQLSEYRDTINQAFASASERLPEYFESIRSELEARGEPTEPLDAAMQWFDDLTQDSGPDDIGKALQEILSDPDNGLATNQRMQIAKWIGAATGNEEAGNAGIVKAALDSLANTGQITVQMPQPDGTQSTQVVNITDTDRLNIAKILADPNITEDGKNEAIARLVNKRIDEKLQSAGDIEAIGKYFSDGNFQAGLDAFTESIVRSLATFSESATKQVYNRIMQDRPGEFTEGVPEGADPRDYVDPQLVEAIQGTGSKMVSQMVQGIETAKTVAIPALEKQVTQANADTARLVDLKNKLSESLDIGLRRTSEAIKTAVQDSGFEATSQNIVNVFSNALRSRNIDPARINWEAITPYAEAYNQLRNLNMMWKTGDEATKNAIEEQFSNTDAWKFIEDPTALIKNNRPIFVHTGIINYLAIANAKNLSTTINNGLSSVSRKIFTSFGFAQSVANAQQQIEQDLSGISDFLQKAGDYREELNSYINAGSQLVGKVRTFSPDEIANLAMEVARLAEKGVSIDEIPYITMNDYRISADDFERVAQGDYGVRPTYVRSAVEGVPEYSGYTPVTAPTEDAWLKQYGQGLEKKETQPPTGKEVDQGGYNIFEKFARAIDPTQVTPIRNIVNAVDPTRWFG